MKVSVKATGVTLVCSFHQGLPAVDMQNIGSEYAVPKVGA